MKYERFKLENYGTNCNSNKTRWFIWRPDEYTSIQINADNIISIVDDPDEDNLGNSIITMSDDSKIFAKETAEEVKQIVNS